MTLRLGHRAAVELAACAAGFAAVILLPSKPVAAAVLGAAALVRLVIAATWHQRLWFVAGALVMLGADRTWLAAGMFRYLDEGPLGIPWYMPAMYGQLMLTVGIVLSLGRAPEGERPSPVPLVADFVILGGATLAGVLLQAAHDGPLTIVMIAILVARCAFDRRDPRALATALIVGIAEPALERTLCALGFMQFLHPGPLGVPNWFPFYFALVSFTARRTYALASPKG